MPTLTQEEISTLISFLMRTTLRGDEAGPFVDLVQKLIQINQPQSKETNNG